MAPRRLVHGDTGTRANFTMNYGDEKTVVQVAIDGPVPDAKPNELLGVSPLQFDPSASSGLSTAAILDARCSIVARGKTYRDDAACGNEIAQRLLVRVRNKNAFPGTLGHKLVYA